MKKWCIQNILWIFNMIRNRRNNKTRKFGGPSKLYLKENPTYKLIIRKSRYIGKIPVINN